MTKEQRDELAELVNRALVQRPPSDQYALLPVIRDLQIIVRDLVSLLERAETGAPRP